MTPTIEYYDRHDGRPVEPNNSPSTVVCVAFADEHRIDLGVADVTPDEDGAIRYRYDITAPGRVFCQCVGLESGRDGRIDLLRALRVLLDIIFGLHGDDERPTSLGATVDAWVDRHWDELGGLYERLLRDVVAR